MIKERAWPAKAMYFFIAAALAISLLIVAAPAGKASADCTADVCAEWEMVDTPTTDGWVLAPDSVIRDYALAEGGDVAYAVVDVYQNGYSIQDGGYHLLKSEDGAATWDDLTDALEDVDDSHNIYKIFQVATDWEDGDFVAVALKEGQEFRVYFSVDGGDSFEDAGEVTDNGVYLGLISDVAISYEDDGEREIAVGGADNSTPAVAALFRCTVDGDNAGAWKDATDYVGNYPGWDDDGTGNFATDPSALVTDIIFSYSWQADRTVLVLTATNESAGVAGGYYTGDVYLQTGVWGPTSAAWNGPAALSDAVPVIEDEDIPFWLRNYDARSIAGIAIPMDYAGDDIDMRYLWVWVNYYDGADSIGMIYRVRDDAVDNVDTQISKTPWLTNVSYRGYKDEGKAIAGVLAESQDYPLDELDLLETCCEGVQVYRNAGITDMEICCLEWDKACKPPTGRVSMAVSYVSDDKAYAVSMGEDPSFIYVDEGAWSVSFDDGSTWNQLSLIDTYIHYISDVAVSPDCNKTFLVTVNDLVGCYCDSVWVYADDFPEFGYSEYSGHWLRTWCGELLGDNSADFPWVTERGLLRLAPSTEEEDGWSVYLVDRMTDTVYYADMETLACWEQGTSTVDEIVDLAVQDEGTILALGSYGAVAMSDDHGAALTWTDTVDSGVEAGWSIVLLDNHVLVGGQDGDVSYAADFDADDEDTFTELEDVYDHDRVYVNVAFDSYFEENDTIYAALAHADDDNGIYILVIGGETDDWTKLNAYPYDYTGIVLDNADGNTKTSPETGGVLYASYFDWGGDRGVARCLTPIVEICCGTGEAEWDYLTVGLDDGVSFVMQPQALKICGCLEPPANNDDQSHNSHLFAIDGFTDYDMEEGDYGAVWTFEDCYGKKGVELTSEDDYIAEVSECECCNEPFIVTWDRLCDACCYEIQFALDPDFEQIYHPTPKNGGGDGMIDDFTEGYCIEDNPTSPSAWFGCYFDTGRTYYWRVRAVEAETYQEIKSWWSEPLSFMVRSSKAGLSLDYPMAEYDRTPVDNLGFGWSIVAEADEFDWELMTASGTEVDSAEALTDTTYVYTGTLDYDTTYKWMVTAYNDGVAIDYAGATFRTMEEPVEPEEPETPGTPVWVWVVIGIGAALVIVVIVLIFRTRRV